MKDEIVIIDTNFDQMAGPRRTDDDDISIEIMDRHGIAQCMVNILACEAVLPRTLQEPHDGNCICHTAQVSTFVTNTRKVVSKPQGRRVHVRKGKVTARKVSEVLNSVARLVRAVGVLVDALSKWIGQAILLLGESPGCYPGGSPPLWLAPLSPVHSAARLIKDARVVGSVPY